MDGRNHGSGGFPSVGVGGGTGGGGGFHFGTANGIIGGSAGGHGSVWGQVGVGFSGGRNNGDDYYGAPYGYAPPPNPYNPYFPRGYFGPGGAYYGVAPGSDQPPDYNDSKRAGYAAKVASDLQLDGPWDGKTRNSTIPFVANPFESLQFYRTGQDNYQIVVNDTQNGKFVKIDANAQTVRSSLELLKLRPEVGGGTYGLASQIIKMAGGTPQSSAQVAPPASQPTAQPTAPIPLTPQAPPAGAPATPPAAPAQAAPKAPSTTNFSTPATIASTNPEVARTLRIFHHDELLKGGQGGQNEYIEMAKALAQIDPAKLAVMNNKLEEYQKGVGTIDQSNMSGPQAQKLMADGEQAINTAIQATRGVGGHQTTDNITAILSQVTTYGYGLSRGSQPTSLVPAAANAPPRASLNSQTAKTPPPSKAPAAAPAAGANCFKFNGSPRCD